MSNNDYTQQEKRKIAAERAQELRSTIQDYLDVRDSIPSGRALADRINQQKQKILTLLGGDDKDWDNWKWQMRNRIADVNTMAQIIDLTEEEVGQINKTGASFRWAISPYYASLIDPDDPKCPVRLQALPSIQELEDEYGILDPMAEEFTSPAPAITRRYPDRLIINVTNQCAMYCRHCQRRRNIGEVDQNTSREDLQAALDYIRANPEIRDVLVTGGDALMLSDQLLDWLLGELHKIEHVEIKRLGTRTLVSMPQRITDELCAILEKYHPLFLNTQFNHPLEITETAAQAAAKLSKAGIPLGNQAVLLAGINNDYNVMKKLNHELLKVRIRPYYIFHAKNVKGTSHFATKIETGLEIMDKLRGYTSGMAVPTYIVNAPKGMGKTPLVPEYLISLDGDKARIRTWEKKTLEYPNK
ncbi:MAG: glutamate 2,3-aminomutase [Firmicutes bacterium]|nr:glutamate 2,3-aminomutase [Bacillota bacterium]